MGLETGSALRPMAKGLQALNTVRAKYKRQPFAAAVKAHCGYAVLPVNVKSPEGKDLMDALERVLQNFVRAGKDIGYRGKRINEVGKKLEQVIEEELKKEDFAPSRLRSSGYPDLFLTRDGHPVYADVKVSSADEATSKNRYRMFYYSVGSRKKVTTDAHHLLIQIWMKREEADFWSVVRWSVRDLHGLEVQLKVEWNAEYPDVRNILPLRTGDATTRTASTNSAKTKRRPAN